MLRMHSDHLIGLGQQRLVVSADQHQPLLCAFANDQPNPSSNLGIQESGWFVKHLKRLLVKPGAQQS